MNTTQESMHAQDRMDARLYAGVLKPFTESDWDGFAGASDLPDGTPPLIGGSSDGGWFAIVSGNGLNQDVHVEVYDDHDNMWAREFTSPDEAVVFLRGLFALPVVLDGTLLEQCGFDQRMRDGAI